MHPPIKLKINNHYQKSFYKIHLSKEEFSWFDECINNLGNQFDKRKFYLNFSLISRKLKSDFSIQIFIQHQNKEYNFIFNIIDVARLEFIRTLAKIDEATYINLLNELFESADLGEQISLYKCLYFMPKCDNLIHRAEEGLRSNVKSIFESVALCNVYPFIFFSTNTWNQMVLKGLFVESDINHIIGLIEKNNKELSQMCLNYYHERMAASRDVDPDIWKLMAGFIDETYLKAIENSLLNGNEQEKRSVSSALLQSNLNNNSNFTKVIQIAEKILNKKTSGI